METLLDELDLIEHTELSMQNKTTQINASEESTVEKTKKIDVYKKADKKCKSQIVQRIVDSHLECVKDKDTAFEIWKTLQDTFERKDMASQLLIRKALLSMRFNPSKDTMDAHFLKFDS